MTVRRKCMKFYHTIRGVLTPTLRYSQEIYEDLLDSIVTSETCWLDAGCGTEILPTWRLEHEKELVSRCKEIIGIDCMADVLSNNRSIRKTVLADLHNPLPFDDNYFNLVTSNMVLEHLDRADVFFAECQRILKPGGTLVIHTPNKRSYNAFITSFLPDGFKEWLAGLLHGRSEDDVFHTYYRAKTCEVLEQLGNDGKLDLKQIRLLVSTPETAVIPPLMIMELLFIKLLMTRAFKRWRPNILAVWQKTV